MSSYNLKSPAVKRIMQEIKELQKPTSIYYAQPLQDDIFEWHFTIKGPDSTPYSKGIYHGRIILPPEYPFKPPSIFWLTPNGRFEINTKICLSISSYHPEYWRPSWSIRTVLLALISYMPSDGAGNIGSINYADEEKIRLALLSVSYKCMVCEVENKELLLPMEPEMVGESSDTTTNTIDQLMTAADREAISQIVVSKPQSTASLSSVSNTSTNVNVTPSKSTGTTSSETVSISSMIENTPLGSKNECENEIARLTNSVVGNSPRTISTNQSQNLLPAPIQEQCIHSFGETVGEMGLTLMIWAVFISLVGIAVKLFNNKPPVHD